MLARESPALKAVDAGGYFTRCIAMASSLRGMALLGIAGRNPGGHICTPSISGNYLSRSRIYKMATLTSIVTVTIVSMAALFLANVVYLACLYAKDESLSK